MGTFGRSGRSKVSPTASELPLNLGDRAAIFAAELLAPGVGQQIRYNKTIRPLQRDFMANLQSKLGPQYASSPQVQVDTSSLATPGAEAPDPAAGYQLPQRTADTGLDINSPELAGLALKAQQLGVPINSVLDVLKAQQADVTQGSDGSFYNEHDRSNLGRRLANRANVNNTVVDLNDPENTNRVIPSEPVKGAMPVYDNMGRVIDWKLPAGARGAIGEASQADTTGRTFGTVFNRPNGNGTTTPTLGRDMFGGGGQGGPGVTQSPDDAAYAADLAKASAAQYNGFQAAGQKAGTNITNFTRMNQLLDGLNTGKFTPAGLEFQKAAASVGLQINPKWGRVEAADALSKKLALDAMGGSLGAGFSNADRSFVEAMNPSIMNTPQGRAQMVSFGIARAKREQQVAQMARQWQQAAGRLDKPDRNGKTFFDYLDAYAEAHPLVPVK